MTPRPNRRRLLAALAGSALVRGRTARAAASLRLVVPQPPGGAADALGRLVADGVARRLARPVWVENRPGGGTVAGSLAVARAAPDGNTFGLVFAAHAINQALRPRMPYDAISGFELVCLGGYSLAAVVAHAALPADDVRGLIALARRGAQPLHYATPGVGSATHLTAELFGVEAGIRGQHVPYNGSTPLYTDLLAGRVPLAWVTLESALPHVAAGQLKVLGLTSAGRCARHPQFATIAETLPGFDMRGFFGFVAPPRTPADAVAALQRAIGETLAAPENAESFAMHGVVVGFAPPQAFAAFLRTEVERYAALARRVGLSIE